MQLLAESVQLSQGDSQPWQVVEPVGKKVAPGHDETHDWAVGSKYVPGVQDVQVLDEPEQVAQGLAQAAQVVLVLAYVLVGQTW